MQDTVSNETVLATLERLIAERQALATHTHAQGEGAAVRMSCSQCARREQLDRLLQVERSVQHLEADELVNMAASWLTQSDQTMQRCGIALRDAALKNAFVKATLVASIRLSGQQRLETVKQLDRVTLAAARFVAKLAECQPHIDGQFALTQMRSGGKLHGPELRG
jgi:hypothetical protein